MQKKFFLGLLIFSILTACGKIDKEANTVLADKNQGTDAQRMSFLKKSLDYDKIQHTPGSTKSWRKAWEYYQKLPELYAQKGYTNPQDLRSLRTFVLHAVLSPYKYGVLVNEDQPTQTEALAIIDEFSQVDILDRQVKAVIYKYLQSQGLSTKATSLIEQSKDKWENTSEMGKTLTKLITDLENPPATKVKNKNAKYQQERTYKIAKIKHLAGK